MSGTKLRRIFAVIGGEWKEIGQVKSHTFNQKQPVMKDSTEGFRKINDRERDLIDKLTDRGHQIAEVYKKAQEVTDQEVQISYSQVGNFTIATIARVEKTFGVDDFNVIGLTSGASKRHPDDDPDELVGKNIALSRALKGDYFQGVHAHQASVDDLFQDPDVSDLRF